MPQKVNPIDFENAEGNLLFADAIAEFLARKLPNARLQRDLTDSTVERDIGMFFAHSLIGYTSLLKGLGKVRVNSDVVLAELDAHPEVITEAYQTILRREGVDSAYNMLKDLARGKRLTMADLHAFVDGLEVPESVKAELKAITPRTYTGLAASLAKDGF